jgi:hypothetical protein
MAWSPVQRSNAGIIWVKQPGDYANPIPTTPATGPKGQAHFEKLAGVKSPEEAFQLQTSFAKSAYDDCIGRIEKITEMYSDLVKAAVPQSDNSLPKKAATKGR